MVQSNPNHPIEHKNTTPQFEAINSVLGMYSEAANEQLTGRITNASKTIKGMPEGVLLSLNNILSTGTVVGFDKNMAANDEFRTNKLKFG